MSGPRATRIDEVLGALFASWDADPGLGALECAVFDGPWVTDVSASRRLHVGGTGLDEDDNPAVTSTQLSPHANNVARDEEIRVRCAAWNVTGEISMTAARAGVQELINLAVAMPRSTQNMGLSNVFYVGFDDFELRQLQDANGASAIYAFTVVVRCRIYI